MCFRWCFKNVKRQEVLMNVHVLRFMVLELLRGFVDDVTSIAELQEKLDSISQENILAEHWVKNLIRPVFLMNSCRKRRRISLRPLCLSKNAPIFLCCGTYKLCKICTLLSNEYVNITSKYFG